MFCFLLIISKFSFDTAFSSTGWDFYSFFDEVRATLRGFEIALDCFVRDFAIDLLLFSFDYLIYNKIISFSSFFQRYFSPFKGNTGNKKLLIIGNFEKYLSKKI